jgi:hypothetical protein
MRICGPLRRAVRDDVGIGLHTRATTDVEAAVRVKPVARATAVMSICSPGQRLEWKLSQKNPGMRVPGFTKRYFRTRGGPSRAIFVALFYVHLAELPVDDTEWMFPLARMFDINRWPADRPANAVRRPSAVQRTRTSG